VTIPARGDRNIPGALATGQLATSAIVSGALAIGCSRHIAIERCVPPPAMQPAWPAMQRDGRVPCSGW
jgi:hypothetical protein